ncbi:MAG: hypothetical protein ACYTF0_04645 [Planctomycetota bacterium]
MRRVLAPTAPLLPTQVGDPSGSISAASAAPEQVDEPIPVQVWEQEPTFYQRLQQSLTMRQPRQPRGERPAQSPSVSAQPEDEAAVVASALPAGSDVLAVEAALGLVDDDHVSWDRCRVGDEHGVFQGFVTVQVPAIAGHWWFEIRLRERDSMKTIATDSGGLAILYKIEGQRYSFTFNLSRWKLMLANSASPELHYLIRGESYDQVLTGGTLALWRVWQPEISASPGPDQAP